MGICTCVKRSCVLRLTLGLRSVSAPQSTASTGEDFEEGEVTDPNVGDRVGELAKELDRICMALSKQP